MLVQHRAPSGVVLHHEIEMLQKGAVAAAHVANALRLLLQRPVENFHDDLIHFLEIRFVRAAAAPDIHAAIDQQLDAGFIHARNARISEQQSAHDVEQWEDRRR